MSKHRRQGNSTRRIATASAVVMGTTMLAPGIAGAAEVVVPNTDLSFEVAGLENIPGISSVPEIGQFVPSLQAETFTAGPVATDVTSIAPMASSTSTGQAIVDAARAKIGSPYVYGAAGPSAFDCSGLTSWVYQQAGKTIPRTSQAQASQGQQVSLDQLQAGDIIAYYGGASHVGIYTGNGTIIDALNSGVPVAERALDYMPIHSAVRF
ncbi:C40 family peptidase [Corynebacterium alimapuense]|uniref:Endopeptidase n=1 Tax=Corynebacterium alimapuense TaxID=1576874 RepID=A0A3M8KAM0_9CORY|nr:C40 family peptidase [Corynebacterium alimapuense]RNE49508.1 endopeptidase [Corynebacterium alimapuense]